MSDDWKFNWADFDDKIVRRMATSARGALPIMVEQARGIVRGTMQVTPPGNKGLDGLSTKARAHGKSMIASDLLGGGSRNKNHRTGGIFAPMDRSLIEGAVEVHGDSIQRLWVKKDGTPYGVENDLFRPDATLSDMRTHHKKYFKNGRMTRAGGATRDIGRWKFVDKMVVPKETFAAYLKEQQEKVGYLLSGWRVAANKLGVSISAWVANADAPSTVIVSVTENRLYFKATNEISWASVRITKSRVQYAIDQQAAKMERQWKTWMENRFR
jgi:hypothetical protein